MKNKLNILTLSLRYPPAPGGAEQIIFKTVNGLKNRGHKMDVFTSDLKSHSIPPCYLSKEEYQNEPQNIHRFPARYFQKFPYPYFKNLFKEALKVKKLDLIYAHNFYYYSADIAYLIAKIKKVPFVLHPYFYTESREALKWKIYRKTLGKFAMSADCVIAITEFEKNLIQKNYHPKRIEIVAPGIDPAIRQKISYNIYDQFGISDKKIILFAGRICYGKGVDVLFKAFQKITTKHQDAVIALSGTDFADKETFVKLANNLNIQDKIIWLGELSRESLHSAYQNATIFCLPTKYEAFGIVLAEAMAAGLPIVSTNHSAVQYVVPNQKAGLLAPVGDYQKIAQYLDLLLSDENLRRQMGEEGKKEAQKYDWAKMVGEIEKIFYSVVK